MLYNKILEHIILPVGDFINQSKFIKELNFWRNVDTLSAAELKELSNKRLEKILTFATENTRFYSQVKKEENVVNWLKNFPIIDKHTLNKNYKDFLTEPENKLTKISSSGSSGVQTNVFMNTKDLAALRAGLVHWWEWSGYKMGAPIIQTGITPQRGLLKAIKDKLFKTIYVNAFIHSEEQIINILKKVKGNDFMLIGYASSLNVIADVAKKHQFNIKLKSAISLGDKLFSHYRKNIEEVFNCKVYDTYGSAEGFLIAAQHDLEYLYILSPQTYLEILDDNGNEVPDGTMGNIVVTRIDGFAMPLIRYKIGDLGMLLPKEKYPKNRKFEYPLLQQIVGRNTDVVKTYSGKTMVVHSFTGIFEYIPQVKQFKIVQHNLQGITVEIIKGETFDETTLDYVYKKLQEVIQDEKFAIDFKIVTKIEASKSGKPQIIESHLHNA